MPAPSRRRTVTAALAFSALVQACAVNVTGKDGCRVGQDCPTGVCVANHCSASAPADAIVAPIDGPVATADAAALDAPTPPQSLMDAAAATPPADAPVDREAVPADTGSEAVADGTICDLLNECCIPCPQGCDQGQCRLSLSGDWEDGQGNTIHVFQNQAVLLFTYIDGPQAGWAISGAFISRLVIEGDFATDQKVTGTISADGNAITWSSGGGWTRK